MEDKDDKHALRQHAITLYSIYNRGYAFPAWVLNPEEWAAASWRDTFALYHAKDSREDVKRLLLRREPCNIAMQRMYDKEAMKLAFGWSRGAYKAHAPDHMMPNIAVVCRATVRTPAGRRLKVWLLNLIGVAHDTHAQPDFRVYNTQALVQSAYKGMWQLVLAAAKHLKKHDKIDAICVYNVGSGAFARLSEFKDFVTECFEPAFLPLWPEFTEARIAVKGFCRTTHSFNGGLIPDVLDEEKDVERVLWVNAWDPWSFVGNGNAKDSSLDGYWGRSSNAAVLCWPITNPRMRLLAVRS